MTEAIMERRVFLVDDLVTMRTLIERMGSYLTWPRRAIASSAGVLLTRRLPAGFGA
jgi:hypothetical protein